MVKTANLGDFEQILLLAILRLEAVGAYGVNIGNEIANHTRRKPAPGAIYTTLERLQHKGLVNSHIGEATAQRGGRSKRLYKVTAEGKAVLRQSQQDYKNLLQGLNLLRGIVCV